LSLASVAILLIISAVIWTVKRPSVAIGLLVSLYAAEQILAGNLPFLGAYPQAYNFFIGSVCLAAIGIALVRFGLPRPPLDYLGAFAALFFLVCASLAWTSSPFLGAKLVKHFAVEIPFAILLPIATLRSTDDFRPPIQVSILLAAIVALGVISSPLIESYSGRTYLAEGWTVLSPAEFTGVAFIFLAILERRFLGFLATFRLPIAVILALGTLLTGARAQFLLAIGIAGAIRLARLYRTQLTGVLATIAMALISILIACLVMVSDVNIPSFRASDRFTTESMGQGVEVRLGFIRESLTLDSPVFGNGVGAWSYMHNRVDVKPGQKGDLILYPHNSLAEVYFEFGTVGLLLFCSILYIGARNARLLFIRYKNEPELRSLTAAITAYFIYSFLLSLKQSTFLAAIGLYLSISMLCALIQMHRTETQKSASIKDPTLSDSQPLSIGAAKDR
jgi:O-antigen ligase